jgi:hypothetical protein
VDVPRWLTETYQKASDATASEHGGKSLLILPTFRQHCYEVESIYRTGSTSERSQGMDAMHLLLIAIAILGDLAGIVFLAGRCPINRALRWKKE